MTGHPEKQPSEPQMPDYELHVSPISYGHSGYWDHQYVIVCQHFQPPYAQDRFGRDITHKPVAEYKYNYHGTPPFLAFEQEGHPYALIARNYVAAAVVDLEGGVVIAEEELSAFGFCPVRFEHNDGAFSVYGCIWGDAYGTCSLDLGRIRQGAISRGPTVYENEDEDDDE